jgi:hypothetical protein
MKKMVRLMLATLVLLSAVSISSFADGGAQRPRARRGIAAGSEPSRVGKLRSKLLVGRLVCE